MSKPSSFPDWANSNPTDPVSLQPARIEPSAGKKATGFLNEEAPPRQDHNWLFWNVGKWIRFFEEEKIKPVIKYDSSGDVTTDGTLTVSFSEVYYKLIEDSVSINFSIGVNITSPATYILLDLSFIPGWVEFPGSRFLTYIGGQVVRVDTTSNGVKIYHLDGTSSLPTGPQNIFFTFWTPLNVA